MGMVVEGKGQSNAVSSVGVERWGSTDRVAVRLPLPKQDDNGNPHPSSMTQTVDSPGRSRTGSKEGWKLFEKV